MPASFGRGLCGCLLATALACQPVGGPGTRGPDEAGGGHVEDAAGLPGFDGADAPGPAEIERFKVALGDAPLRGNATAPVTVVMFSDFECPYCRDGYLNLRELERRYDGRVRIAYKAFPLDFHSAALPAAIAARTAQAAGKFWEFHDRLYATKQVDLNRLFEYAKDAGLDPKALARDLDSLEFGPEVRRDMRQASGSCPAHRLGGVPEFSPCRFSATQASGRALPRRSTRSIPDPGHCHAFFSKSRRANASAEREQARRRGPEGLDALCACRALVCAGRRQTARRPEPATRTPRRCRATPYRAWRGPRAAAPRARHSWEPATRRSLRGRPNAIRRPRKMRDSRRALCFLQRT